MKHGRNAPMRPSKLSAAQLLMAQNEKKRQPMAVNSPRLMFSKALQFAKRRSQEKKKKRNKKSIYEVSSEFNENKISYNGRTYASHGRGPGFDYWHHMTPLSPFRIGSYGPLNFRTSGPHFWAELSWGSPCTPPSNPTLLFSGSITSHPTGPASWHFSAELRKKSRKNWSCVSVIQIVASAKSHLEICCPER